MGPREQALQRIRAVTIGLAALAAVGSAAVAAAARADTTAAPNTTATPGTTSAQTTNPDNGGTDTGQDGGGFGFDGGPQVDTGTRDGHATSGGT